jgi:hypothetical protein
LTGTILLYGSEHTNIRYVNFLHRLSPSNHWGGGTGGLDATGKNYVGKRFKLDK